VGKTILFYLETFQRRFIVGATHHDHSVCSIDDHSCWLEFYADAEQQVPRDVSATKGTKG
jgi:hypothetical protein